MHVAAVTQLDDHLLPQARELATAIEAKADRWEKVVKIGRTHTSVKCSEATRSGWAAASASATSHPTSPAETTYRS